MVEINESLYLITYSKHTTIYSFQNMKMPEKQSKDSGIYDCQENQYCNEELENNAIEEINAPAENDFSEYLWMENEEEFDKEVN